MSNATSHSPSAPASKAARSFSRFVRTSVRPVVFKLSRKLSVTYWPGRRRTISAVLLALLSGFVPGLAGAGPTGGQVVAGTAKLLKPTSTTTQINQTSQNVIINWQSFSIGAGEAVRFVQPSASAVALNRVIGSDPSRIFGTLQANGKVFLVNNAGVYFAPGASVDVGGLVATSMNISNGSFLSGKYKFEAGANAGAVANDGQLRGAFVVLAAPQVTNAGSIVTTGGATALAAGGRVSLDIAGDKLVTMSVDAAAANAAVVNSGNVSADGGKVFMSASSANAVLDTVINTSGIVRAGSIGLRNGQIVIDGGDAGVVKVSGTLAASGAGAGAGGGAVKVLGDQVALLNGARIDVSGDTGGGSALVGGDLHGAGGVKTAASTRVEAGAVINADALASGDGGKVVVWADQHTGFAGAISAKGGAQGGDGGFVETSGKATLAFAGKVDTTAARGATGSLLLDPTNITIDTAGSAGLGVAGGTYTGTAATSTLNVGDLTTALASTNVIVDTTSAQASAGNIIVATNVNWASANSLTLKADTNITNNAQINANGGGAINLHGDGVVNAGTLSSAGGDIHIAGTAGGSSKAGSVNGTSINSAGGNVVVQSAGAVSTGAINAGAGTISIIGNAGVAINGALSSTNSGNAAIVVNAGANGMPGNGGGGDITVAGGSVTVASGRATLYTGSIAGSTGVTATAGAGSGRFRYGSALGTDNFSAALGNGVNVVYREQPTLTLTGTSPTVTYGDADPTFGFNYVGLRNGDTSGQALTGPISVSATGTLSGSGHTNAGTYAVTPSGGADQLGYNVAHANGTFTVDRKTLTASVSAPNKVYDGATSATPTLTVSGLVGTETLGVSATATFNSKNVATANLVTVNSVTLANGTLGGAAGNYVLGAGQTVAANITPKALTATLGAADKAYDGNLVATAAMNLAGLVGSEIVAGTGTGVFDSKDVLAAGNVTVNTIALANGGNGGLASNYSVAAGQTGAAHITPRSLTATVTAPDKVYDGGAAAAATLAISGGLVAGESLGVSGSGVFNSKDVVSANQVTVQSVSLTDGAGGLATNYSLGAGQTATAHITPKALTATLGAADKAYDGNLAATAAMNLAGLVGTETVAGTGTGVFDRKDVLTAGNVTVNAIALADGANGGLASNYSVAAGQTGVAHITPKALTATAAAADKTYDGGTAAAPTVSIASGLVGAETVSASGAGVFNSKDVLAANQVTVQSVALADGANGGLASNYSLAAGQTATAHITPKALTATAVAFDKVYDGDALAAPIVSIAGGLVGAETVIASGSGTFNSKDVLAANQMTVQSVTLANGAGGLASNYSLAAGQTATAHITPKALTVTVNAADKTYDGNANASGSLNIASGLVGAETVTASGASVFNSKDVLTANLVTVQSLALSDGANGGLASNYSAGTGQTVTAHITPKSLTATAAAPDKVYDGSLGAAPALSIVSGLVGAETVTASGTGVFNSKDVSGASQVTVQSVALADGANGGLASNYGLGAGQTATAHITPKALTATVAASDKIYDGGIAAAAVMNLAGLVGAETVTGTGTGVFNSKDVLSANQVTVDSVTLANGAGGGLASNYMLGTGQTGTAHITPKALTATAAAADKTYDGGTAAAPTVSIASGLVGAETVSASGAGVFNSKDVLAANQVTVQSVALADGANGGLASNYSLAAGQTATAHITPKALTATALAFDKVYDGNALAAPIVSIGGGLVGAETVIASGSGTFNSKDVLAANQVTVQSVALANGAGGLASNYSLAAGQTATAHITPKALTVTVNAADKAYDGNANASGSLNIASGLVGAETVTASGASAFNSKDVLTANLVTVQSLALSDGANGGLASNYSAGTGQTTTAHITPKSLTAIAAAADKVYDGGTAATAVMNIGAASLVGAETVTGTGSGVFDSKDVASAGVVTVQSVVLADGANGGLASNYSLATGQTGAAHITPKSLTATATASDKVYDGNLGAAAALSVASGLVGAETLGVTGTATFNTKDVLTANLVTVNGVALANGANGGLASNYSLGSGQSATAHISRKALTATAAAPNKTYDGTLVAAPTLSIASGLVGAETVSASGTGVFNSKDVLAANLVTVQSVALANGANGGIASNYSLGAGQTVTSHITPKALTASAAAADKVYDGGLGATAVMNIAAAGLVGTETVTGTGTGVFNSKDVLNANLVTVQAVTLANGANGGLASNYSLGNGQTGAAHITSKALTATATAPDKVYDGNLVAAPVLSIASGLVGAETLGVSATGAFNSKDVLAANLVTVNGVALANGANGGIASNYSLAAGQTASAHVTPKALSATVAASGKVYDGTTTAGNVLTIASGLVGAEKVTATGSAVFNSKDVLAASQVTVQTAVLSNGANGGLASNYSLAPGQVAGNVHITARPLTASAAAADKVYDGNLGGSAVMNIDAAGLVGSETISASGTGLFNSKDVGSAAAVTVNTVQLANGANGGLASNYSLGTGQVGAAKITRRPSVTWVGGASGNWADAANWEVGAIPDLANVANVIIPAGKSVLFNASVPSQKGVVQLDGIDGAGALVVSGGTLNVANALKVGSYTQSAGEVDASTLGAAGNFNQTGGKLVVSGNVDIVQSSGTASFGDLSAANLSLKGGGATQAAGSAVLVSDTLTLDTGAGDVLLANKRNDFGKVVIASAHDVTLSDINGLDVKGDVSGTLTTSSDTLTVGPTKVGGNFIASALGAISQTGALDVAGSTIVDSAGSLRLDDKKNALRGRVKVNAGGDVLLASAGGLAIGGDVGGKLVLTASGPVIQTAGDALHVAGTSSIDAGAGAVTLTEADNHFTGPLSVRGGALSVVDKGALALGESSVAGNLLINSGGALTQAGKLTVTGASTIAAKGQVVTLDDAGNTFGGKMTLGAASATVNAAGPLAVDSDVDGALTLGSPDLKLNAANALNLHLNTGAAAISAGKSISIDGSATGPLVVTAGGAVTQGGALVAGGTTSISAPGQAISLTNAGNDFGGELSLAGAATQVTDKNGLILGSSDVKGNLQLTAKGDVTQKGVLNVGGATAIDTTGAVVLGNEGNDFTGPVSATAGSVMLKDKNVLTVAKLSASKAELSAGSELQVAPGGIVDAPDIALSLSPTAVKGAIGTPVNKFEVRKGARIVLGANTPAVPTYIGGDGAQVVVGNLAASINYSNEAWSMDARTRVNSSVANILQASQKKADSNAVLIERGLPTDLTVPIPYPHEGAMRTRAPVCIGNAADCPAEP